MKILKIYCAGGDVFLPPAASRQQFDRMKQWAAACSNSHIELVLLIPIDNEISLLPGKEEADKRSNALRIRLANEAMIQECDAVIANLSPFRSAEPDSGTAYECGFARALGKPVLTYTDNPAEQTAKYAGFDFAAPAPDGRHRYTEIEDFALPFNLMMYGEDFPVFSSFQAALQYYADNIKPPAMPV